MRNFLCWDPGSVRQVINPFAEHTPDSLFKAVHSDWDLNVTPPVGKRFQDIFEASWNELTQRQFLADFLSDERPHSLAAILGETGSGKSHLVHWMRLHIKSDKTRLVLLVPKSGTSLRAIVRMIIDELPTEEQKSFLDTLHSAGDGTQTRAGQKEQLLNDLAQVIREEVVALDAEEIERELVSHLPNLFQDPYMRVTHFLGDDTVISEIVDHIFAPSNAQDRPEKRRSFETSDLPLGGLDFANASRLAQSAMQIIALDNEKHTQLAVDIINRNLDKAVARTLSFSGDRVEELMTRLRAHLKVQGRELVLLVEEFARLQGIDRALLQSITSHGDEHLCKMRSAIAVTTGFFESVAQTAYMRTTHIVDMNRSAGRADGHVVTSASLSKFASRYLNAVRLGRADIERWAEDSTAADKPPSRCLNCPHKSECHELFGEVDGYGLYPFTPRALWNASRRANGSLPESLNPRVLQNDLLVEVLDNYGDSIQSGSFPPFQLLEKLKGVIYLSSAAQIQLEARNPQASGRWKAFLELYDGSGEIRNLDARLRDAFDVPEIPGASDDPGLIVEDDFEQPSEKKIPALSREDVALEIWSNGGDLDQNVAGTLRPLIFSAVSDAIDWDMLGLAKAAFVNATTGRPFMQRSIIFERQTTQFRSYLGVKLEIPGPLLSPRLAAAALQGLLRANKSKFSWDFENGDRMLAAFLDCVDVWARSVEEQLLAVCSPTPTWDQAAAAVELLCVGATIGGKIRSEASVAEFIEGAFSTWQIDCASRSKEMRGAYDDLLGGREKLTQIARAQISSMKGGQVGAMLAPSRVVPIIRNIRQSKWSLTLVPPDEDKSDLAELYRNIQKALPVAAAAEMNDRQQWLREMDEAFGEGATRSTIVPALEKAQLAALEAGIGSNNTAKPLADALERIRNVYFDDSLAAARSLAKYDDALSALNHFGRGRRNGVEAGTSLANAAKGFLDAIDQNAAANSRSHEAKHSALASSITSIHGALEAIETDLRLMGDLSQETSDAA
ncbi:protein DpdH [Rhizobium ruizarguesonis]